MRKIIVSAMVSMDGVMQAVGGPSVARTPAAHLTSCHYGPFSIQRPKGGAQIGIQLGPTTAK